MDGVFVVKTVAYVCFSEQKRKEKIEEGNQSVNIKESSGEAPKKISKDRKKEGKGCDFDFLIF